VPPLPWPLVIKSAVGVVKAEAQKKDEECVEEILAAQQMAKKVKDVNVAEAREKERMMQLYSFKMVEQADNIKNNTEKGSLVRRSC